jgi:hypothetical protein
LGRELLRVAGKHKYGCHGRRQAVVHGAQRVQPTQRLDHGQVGRVGGQATAANRDLQEAPHATGVYVVEGGQESGIRSQTLESNLGMVQ